LLCQISTQACVQSAFYFGYLFSVLYPQPWSCSVLVTKVAILCGFSSYTPLGALLFYPAAEDSNFIATFLLAPLYYRCGLAFLETSGLILQLCALAHLKQGPNIA